MKSPHYESLPIPSAYEPLCRKSISSIELLNDGTIGIKDDNYELNDYHDLSNTRS